MKTLFGSAATKHGHHLQGAKLVAWSTVSKAAQYSTSERSAAYHIIAQLTKLGERLGSQKERPSRGQSHKAGSLPRSPCNSTIQTPALA